LDTLSKIGNFNKTEITVRDYDLVPGKQMNFKAQILTPYNVYITTEYYNVIVPPIASGKRYCGPCQLNDRTKCIQFNNVCWIDYMNYAISDPFNTTECLKAMAPICYQIWNTSTSSLDDPQCLDFKNYYNYTAMKIQPFLLSAAYSSRGDIITLQFDEAIQQSNWVDCSNAFEYETIKWLPRSKSCKWTSPKTLEVDYEPQFGIMRQLTIKSTVFYYSYFYSQNPANQTTITVRLPVLDSTIKINCISFVSECDTLNLFGTVVTPTLYPLTFKWEVSFSPSLDQSLLTEVNDLLNQNSEFGNTNAITIPSKMLKRGAKITVTLSAKAANFESKIISTSTVVNVFGNIPKIKFTSKSQYVLEINGDKSTFIPMLVDNTKCFGNAANIFNEFIPIDVSFYITTGISADSINLREDEEIEIEKILLSEYTKFKSIFVGNRFGFKYLKYYNITVIATAKDDGTKNTDSIILFFTKPPIKSIIDSPGTLVSINTDVQLNGINSEFPALENDTKSYIWKCISAKTMELGGSCDCPILTESGLKSANLIIPKDKLFNMCKYQFSLIVMASNGLYSRTANNETEFMTLPSSAASMKAKLIENSNTEVNDMYLTFGTDANLATSTNPVYKWVLAEVESTDPKIQEKYTEKNKFIYEFLKNELAANPDPAIKDGDINIPNGRRRKLTDITPNYITPTTARILGIDKTGLLPLYKYTFAVTVYSGSTPTFLFIQYTMPPAPRTRIFTVDPVSGFAFGTSFGFTFTLPSSTDVDEAFYQLFRKNCPGSDNAITALTQKFSSSNTYKAMLGPALKTCDNKVEIILRVYEYNAYIDITRNITINDPLLPVDQALNQQAHTLIENTDLTMYQKLTIMAEISNVPVTETLDEYKVIASTILEQLDPIDKQGGVLTMLEPKEQVELLGITTQTISHLVISQEPNIDVSTAYSITGKIDSYITAVETKESGTYLIPSALAALSAIADIGTTQQSAKEFFAEMQNVMNKMTDMKLAEMIPGVPPYSLTSPAIEMIVTKNYAEDYNNIKTFETEGGVNIQMPDGIADQMIKSMNTTTNGTVTFGASVFATSFNPFTNIKNATNISISSLSAASLNGFLNTTIQRIYEDMSKGLLENVVNKREQATDLVQLAFRPFQFNNDASQNQLNATVQVGGLPPGKKSIFSIPAPANMSTLINSTIMVPLYFVPENDIWTNENCTLDKPNANSTFLIMKCNHMGKGKITSINQGFSVTIDVIKDVLSVIRAGNYQQLANLSVLLEVNKRSIAAYASISAIGVFIVLIVLLLKKIDKYDIYKIKLNCLIKLFNPKSEPVQTSILHRILKFFSQIRKKGMRNVTKKSQKVIEPKKYENPTEEKLSSFKKYVKEKKKANGFSRLSIDDKEELNDAYNIYKQCLGIYNGDELNEIMRVELESAKVLNRKTQVYIDDMILREPVTFWMMMRNENEIFNAVLKPEITTPRPLKFLVFACVLIGELFVTGFFYNPEETISITKNSSAVVSKAVVYSIAATVLMIPLKIIISLFMTGKGISEYMTREEIEAAERNGPILKFIGLVLGFSWLGFCLYSIMMYIITFKEIALQNWLTTYGISVFTELIIINQIKVFLKVLIGLILMQIAQSRAMMSTAGIMANYIIDNLIKLL